MRSIADIDTATEQAARAFIAKVAGQYDLAGAILFGSRARKSHRPDSDADIAVLLHGHPSSVSWVWARQPSKCCSNNQGLAV